MSLPYRAIDSKAIMSRADNSANDNQLLSRSAPLLPTTRKPSIQPIVVPNTPMTPLVLEDRIMAGTRSSVQTPEVARISKIIEERDYFNSREPILFE
ncbi:hypothetical protein NQZ79_g7722 [Umbelopsis isabellina]|nr:hypothetical protein NQZ79_g7722 [Umbelopsis isabellina]